MTILHEPPLTLEWTEQSVRTLREAHRDALREIAKLTIHAERYGRTMEATEKHQERSDTLRTIFVYMLAWHRVEGDPVAMARELSKLAEFLPTGDPLARDPL